MAEGEALVKERRSSETGGNERMEERIGRMRKGKKVREEGQGDQDKKYGEGISGAKEEKEKKEVRMEKQV